MPKKRRNEPVAKVLMNSMRSIGYSFNAAVADVIDNSISAHASRIDVKFPIDPDRLFVAICDNGCGMNKEELFDAMKYGSELKQSGRTTDDLGRYGLGLKAASLSQCRKLTVLSKKGGELSACAWNLDSIFSSSDWLMDEYTDSEINNLMFFDYLSSLENGTVVIWENFDFIEKNEGDVYLGLSKLEDNLAAYLELIFHRFLNKDGNHKLEMWINNYQLQTRDPFLEKHKKTNIRRLINIPVMDSNGIERMVTAQPFILPFQKDMSKEDKKLVGGMEDYRINQGFYIYRNERLIIWGTWFGRHKDELTKHARIRVDIPNSLDDIWGLDVKKQKATIPNSIKRQLTKAVDEAMSIAVKVQTYRGRTTNKDANPIWNRIVNEHTDSCRYEINRDAKIFDLIKSSVDDQTWQHIDMVLEEIESAVPFQQIYIDKSQNKIDETEDDDVRTQEIEIKARLLIKMAKEINPDQGKDSIITEIFKDEPFNNFNDVRDKLLKENG